MASQPDESYIAALLEARSRLDLSMAVIPIVHMRQRQRMLAWYDLMLRDAAATSRPVELTATVPWNRQRLCWRITGERTVTWQPFTDYLSDLNARDRAVPALQMLGDIGGIERFGAWLEASAYGLEMGWHCPQPLPLAGVLPFFIDSGDKQAIQSWMQHHGVSVCLALTQSIHPEQPWTEICLELPTDSMLDQLHIARALYRALSMPVPENGAYSGLLRAATGNLRLLLGLSRSGPVRIGISADTPTAEGAVQLANESHGFHAEAMSAFQAALGVESAPRSVTWLQDATGVGAELSFAVAADATASGSSVG